MISNNYQCLQGYECLAGCIFNYFNYYNVPLNESDIFLSGKGFKLEYSGEIRYLRIGTKAYQANELFLKRYKIPHNHNRLPSRQRAKLFIERCIASELPLIVRVNTGKLTYHNVYKTSMASPHWLNVIGMSDTAYVISDSAIPAIKREHIVATVGKDEILSSWEDMQYEHIVLDIKKLKDIEVEIIKEDSINMFYEGINKYLNPKKRLFSTKIEGIQVIPCLVKDLKMCRYDTKEELEAVIKDVNYQVKLKGVVTYRHIVSAKLHELGYEQDIITRYDDVTDRWNGLFFMLMKIGLTGKEEQIDRLVEEAEQVCEYDRKVLSAVLENCDMVLKKKGEKLENERRGKAIIYYWRI